MNQREWLRPGPSAHESYSCPSAVGRLQTDPGSKSRSTPPTPSSLSLIWPLLYKFRDCTRLAQLPLPVPSQRTKPAPGFIPWLQSSCCESPRDEQFKVGKAFRGHTAVPLPTLPENPLWGLSTEEHYQTARSRGCQASLSLTILCTDCLRAALPSGPQVTPHQNGVSQVVTAQSFSAPRTAPTTGPLGFLHHWPHWPRKKRRVFTPLLEQALLL